MDGETGESRTPPETIFCLCRLEGRYSIKPGVVKTLVGKELHQPDVNLRFLILNHMNLVLDAILIQQLDNDFLLCYSIRKT